MSRRDQYAYYDAVVVGARCAGASTALLLARAGLRVLVVDRQDYGSDRISTHAIMRTGVLQLARWGVLAEVMNCATPVINRVSFIYGGRPVELEVAPAEGVPGLIAPRRTVLDRLLVDAAAQAGAAFRHRTMVRGLMHDRQGRVSGVRIEGEGGTETVRCGMVIGADGRQSTVARLVGAPIYRQGAHSTATVYSYFEGIPRDGIRWYFEKGTGGGVIPTSNGAHCIFAGVAAAQYSREFGHDLKDGFMKTARRNSPLLAAQIRTARQIEKFHAFAGSGGFFRQSFGDGWALVGDAGYYKDPLTAHGITDALRDAELLAEAIIAADRNSLAAYQAKRDVLSKRLFEVTEKIASLQWDLESLKALHCRLSQAMEAEYVHCAKAVRGRLAA